jgi:hypothetical protein
MKLDTNKPVLEFESEDEKLTDALSAAVVVNEHLWVASDELITIERLTHDGKDKFNQHKSFALKDLIQLPAAGTDADQEVDIEGLDQENSYLWLVGSHSIKRKKVDKKEPASTEKRIKKLAKTEIDGNRFLLARIPLTANGELVSEMPDAEDPQRILKAAQLSGDAKSNELIEALKSPAPGDPHFANFLSIPGKDNGFDIEGLAVAGEQIFMGLRGPVLRGFAGILEVSITEEDSRLKLQEVDSTGRRYKKHFLDLKGLGVRDLCARGSDLLILAGPTMNLDGPVFVFRWPNALTTSGEQLVFSDELQQLFELDFGSGTDHAEGMALVTDGESQQLLVVYDSPGDERKVSKREVKADVFDLPSM